MVLPLDYEHSIPEDDPVVSFKEVVGGLNLRQYITTSPKGRQDYDPEVMLHLILFGFMENIRSLRKLEQACKVDIRFMYLSGGIKPSFMAFQRFIDTKLTESIDAILTSINLFLIEKESINTEVLHIDGTKIEANAHKFSFVWRKAVENYQRKLYLKITKTLKEHQEKYNPLITLKEVYTYEDLDPLRIHILNEIETGSIQFVSGKGTRKHPLQRVYETIKDYQQKLKQYEEHIKICGSRNSYSKTDHDATFMHGKEDYYSKTGIFKPYYNIQIGVSDEYILHCGVYPNPTDTKTWIPFLESFYKRYGYYPKFPVADAGYGSYDNYLYNRDKGMALSMKYNTFSKEDEKSFQKRIFNIKNMKQKQDTLTSSLGHIYRYSHTYTDTRGLYPKEKKIYKFESGDPSNTPLPPPKAISLDNTLLELQEEAKSFLKSEAGINLRIRRSIEVEGAFGDIKGNFEYHRIQRRGTLRVETEISLVVIGYNLRKYHNKKHRVLH